MQSELIAITNRIKERSKPSRERYLSMIKDMQSEGVKRGHLACGNLAHAYAAMDEVEKSRLVEEKAPNIGIISAYNDMLSAHQPYAVYPELIRKFALESGATAQFAGGVPAMCDGVTQGQVGMELSLFSRDVIAQASAIALSHNVYDAALYLGVCDKIVPGLVIAAASFGHIPAVFVPAGPMSTGISNDEKATVRKQFAEGLVGREELLASEMKSYHSAGTCTFYGTANTNQMLMEFMGLHLPGSSFVHPYDEMRHALIEGAVKAALNAPMASEILNVEAYVNGMVGLMASGGSTNLLLHLIAMARASGVILEWSDFSQISEIVPLMARVYPNGMADVNQFHAAGGLGFMVSSLLDAGLLHGENPAIYGTISQYSKEPHLQGGKLHFVEGAKRSLNEKILRSADDPFAKTGGLANLKGNLGEAVMKVSAVDPARHVIRAPAKIFDNQDDVKAAFKAGELNHDVVVVVRFQGPRANGMPELHSLTPALSILQDRGYKVALVTDGRMSGASGKVPAAIHLAPEALSGGAIAQLQDGDMILVDAVNGIISVENPQVFQREMAQMPLSHSSQSFGRGLFDHYRYNAGDATHGASQFFKE